MHALLNSDLKKNNPFYCKSWSDQGYTLTPHRQDQLEKLFGKTVEEIWDFKPNEGRYVAFVAINWGFSKIVKNKLIPTEEWKRLVTSKLQNLNSKL